VQLRFEHLVQIEPEAGGLVLSAIEGPRPLMKIGLAHPTSLRVLIDRLDADDAVESNGAGGDATALVATTAAGA
jgi:hypothetical protein